MDNTIQEEEEHLCVVCTKPCDPILTFKSQMVLSLPFCSKLYKLFFSEIAAVGSLGISKPVFDFSRECLPFCMDCKKVLIQGMKLVEQIRGIQDQLEVYMKSLRTTVLVSPQELLFNDHKLAYLRRTAIKNCKMVEDVNIREFHEKNGIQSITQCLNLETEMTSAENDLVKVIVTRSSTGPTSTSTDGSESGNPIKNSTSPSTSKVSDVVTATPPFSPQRYDSISATATSTSKIGGNSIDVPVNNSGRVSIRIFERRISRKQEEKACVSTASSNEMSDCKPKLTYGKYPEDSIQSSKFINQNRDHDYGSCSIEDDKNMITSKDVETLLEESDTEIILIPTDEPPESKVVPSSGKERRNRHFLTRFRRIRSNKSRTIAAKIIQPASKTKSCVCDICHKVFKTNPGLNGHLWVHNRPYCGLCRKHLDPQTNMGKHRSEIHGISESFSCVYCMKTYPSGEDLQYHIRQHTDDESYTCSKSNCGSTFKTRKEVDVHMQIHARSSSSITPPTLFINSTSSDQQNFLPEDVEISDTDDSGNYDDSVGHIGEISFANYPHLTFTSEDDDKTVENIPVTPTYGEPILGPRKMVQYREIPQFKVPGIPRSQYVQQNQYGRPPSTGMPNLANPANSINRGFPIGKKQGPEVHQCEVCFKKFSTKIKLRCHKRNHPKKVIQCSICDRRFNRLDNLKVHLKSHRTHISQFECHVCKQMFTSNPDLQKHIQTHNVFPIKIEDLTKLSTHECRVCQRRFGSLGALRIHFKSHIRGQKLPQKYRQRKSKDGEFPCEVCGKVYSFASNRRRHIVAVHGAPRTQEWEAVK